MNLKISLKTLFYIVVNVLFGTIIYFISLRPLSPSEEQILLLYENKKFYEFLFECFLFVFIITIIFSSLSILLFNKFKFIIEKKTKKKSLLLIFFIYLIFSTFCSFEYFSYITNLIKW